MREGPVPALQRRGLAHGPGPHDATLPRCPPCRRGGSHGHRWRGGFAKDGLRWMQEGISESGSREVEAFCEALKSRLLQRLRSQSVLPGFRVAQAHRCDCQATWACELGEKVAGLASGQSAASMPFDCAARIAADVGSFELAMLSLTGLVQVLGRSRETLGFRAPDLDEITSILVQPKQATCSQKVPFRIQSRSRPRCFHGLRLAKQRWRLPLEASAFKASRRNRPSSTQTNTITSKPFMKITEKLDSDPA